MAKCPKCGMEVSKPNKKWTMAGRADKHGKKMRLEIGLYECPRCHKTFRNMLTKPKIFVSPIGPPDNPSPFDSPYGPREERRDEEEDSGKEDS